MSNKDIEEDIKICDELKKFLSEDITPKYTVEQSAQALKNILVDRERKIEDIQRLQELLDKSDASNVELEKQLKKYKNMYQAEHQIHLVRNEQLERKERAIQKANKYDNLIGLIKEEIENRNIQAKEHQDETILTIIGREKIILQDLLETIEGGKK